VSTPALVRLLPHRADYRGLRQSWRRDVLAGITVGVVALPLALAFGISSGVGAAAGLITAVVAGLVAAVFGGSPVQVSGPTGAMAVVLAPRLRSCTPWSFSPWCIWPPVRCRRFRCPPWPVC
jgi:SulP family sulfate permease